MKILSRTLLILLSAIGSARYMHATTTSTKSDFVKKTNLLVRIRERTALKSELADLKKLLTKETEKNKLQKLQTKHDELTTKLENFDIYLKNLTIQSLKDPIEALIQVMELANIHYKDTRLLAHKKALLKKSTDKAKKEKLKHDITALEKNITLNNTLLKKTLFKRLDTAENIPEPTKKAREKAREFDQAQAKQKTKHIINSPTGKQVQLLERTIPMAQHIIAALEASLFGLDMGIDQAKNATGTLKDNIGKLLSLVRDLRNLYDKEKRLLSNDLKSLPKKQLAHIEYLASQQKKEFINKPKAFLGDVQRELSYKHAILTDLLEHEKTIMSTLIQAHKKAKSTEHALEKKLSSIAQDKTPILYGLINKLIQKAKLVASTNKLITQQLSQTFKQTKQEMATIAQSLTEEIAP